MPHNPLLDDDSEVAVLIIRAQAAECRRQCAEAKRLRAACVDAIGRLARNPGSESVARAVARELRRWRPATEARCSLPGFQCD